MNVFEKARTFIYLNARPLDLARWQYHFENGSRDAVLAALSAYQNDDGGFGHGLEADCFNPHSSPIQTWTATEILREIGFEDRKHPIVQGILRYLASGADFDQTRRQWMNTVPSNNDYPRAVWWSYTEGEVQYKYNPTACLAGFYLKYADKEEPFYQTAFHIAQEAYRFWIDSMPYHEQHITSCFIQLCQYCTDAGVSVADMDEFRRKLIEQVACELQHDAPKWGNGYVCMPSNFIEEKDSIFCEQNVCLIQKECAYIEENQLEDGSFEVPWQWWTDYKEFELAKNWWKSDICIKKLRFLREFTHEIDA